MRIATYLLPVLLAGAGAGVVAEVATRNTASVQPNRVLDTRAGVGAAKGKLVPGADLAVAVPTALAAGASAVNLNITATEGSADGWVKAWACDDPRPDTSSLNFTPSRIAANASIVGLSPSGTFCLTSSVPVHVVVDVTGWYTGTEDFSVAPPNRLLDTRVTGDPLRAGTERRLKVAGTPGISVSAAVAALNITVDRPALAGWVVAYPCGQPTTSSTVNFSGGEIVANFTVVGLSGGDVCLRSLTDVQVVVDSFGWSSGGAKLRVGAPSRLLDTREASWGQGPAKTNQTIQLRVAGRGGVPTDADAAYITVTVADPSGEGYVTVWPCDEPFPTASTINTFKGALRSNLTLVKLSVAQGTACLRYVGADGGPTNLVVDAVGFMTGSTPRTINTCGLDNPAFCETFDAPAGNGSRTGDLDPVLWGVSRIGVINPSQFVNDISQTSLQGCGTTAFVFAPNDVRICNGVMFESVNDAGGVASLHTYPKQPFDWAGRTGKVVFDVSADSDGSHGAWPEFLITDKPVPGTRVNISGGIPGQYAYNEIGFSIDGCTAGPGGNTGVGRVFLTRNGVYEEVGFQGTGCVAKGSLTSLNHFEVRLSQNRMEVWATDPGASALRQIAVADNLNLQFTKGLVWLDDVHYNARKSVEPCECGTQWNHTFAWDNLGFDGPKTYRDLGFDVPSPNTPGSPGPWFGEPTIRTGFQVGTGPTTLTVPGVFRRQTPTGALLVLNTYALGSSTIPDVSVNGNPYIFTPYPPGAPPDNAWLAPAIPIPLNQIRDGDNTLTFRSNNGSTTVTNISIILVAGDSVP